jgi:hypothetical protein
MEGINYSKNYRHLMGWRGDTANLVQDIRNQKGTLEELIDKANEFFNFSMIMDILALQSYIRFRCTYYIK